MNKLWLIKEPCYVWFDVKPIHEALNTEKLPSSIEIELFGWEYKQYQKALDNFNYWQRVMEKKVNEQK